MKFTKVTPDLYYFYLLSDISTVVTPNERVFVSEEGNPPANDAPMCSTFCKYTGSPKIRTLRRPETSDDIPGNAALCEPCNSTCQVDRCDPNPCQNNGSCMDFKENYTCTCTGGWKGENCTKDINECLDKQRTAMCPQHSDCFNTDGSYRCNCKIGYQETNGTCTEKKMHIKDKSTDLWYRCDPNPCQNNGSCVDFKENYNCTCTDGWRGKNCTTDINECLDKQRTAMCPQHSDC
ncbi:fibropellin-3-like, partial [Mytilus edulis]|uniref:fibropellin-3-like n=1 Tax=Mytilus edulis TaxID=6550 RepID=UPI0039EE325C